MSVEIKENSYDGEEPFVINGFSLPLVERFSSGLPVENTTRVYRLEKAPASISTYLAELFEEPEAVLTHSKNNEIIGRNPGPIYYGELLSPLKDDVWEIVFCNCPADCLAKCDGEPFDCALSEPVAAVRMEGITDPEMLDIWRDRLIAVSLNVRDKFLSSYGNGLIESA